MYKDLLKPYQKLVIEQNKIDNWMKREKSVFYSIFMKKPENPNDILLKYSGKLQHFQKLVKFNTISANKYLESLDKIISDSYLAVKKDLKKKDEIEELLVKVHEIIKVYESKQNVKSINEFYNNTKKIRFYSEEITRIESNVWDYKEKRDLIEKSYKKTQIYISNLNLFSNKSKDLLETINNSSHLLSNHKDSKEITIDSLKLCSRLLKDIGNSLN